MTTERPEPGNGGVDDLGLTGHDWEAIRTGYNFGTMEPVEGIVEAEAFRRLAAETAARPTGYMRHANRMTHTSAASDSRSPEGRLPPD